MFFHFKIPYTEIKESYETSMKTVFIQEHD
jgi:hypothetical protein